MDDSPGLVAAIEYDLLALGQRLRWVWEPDRDLSWGDVYAVVSQAPATSAVARFLAPESHMWGLQEQLQASTFDMLAQISWQLGGAKGKPPESLPRPGIEGHEVADDVAAADRVEDSRDPWDDAGTGGVFRGESVGIDELNDWLGWT